MQPKETGAPGRYDACAVDWIERACPAAPRRFPLPWGRSPHLPASRGVGAVVPVPGECHCWAPERTLVVGRARDVGHARRCRYMVPPIGRIWRRLSVRAARRGSLRRSLRAPNGRRDRYRSGPSAPCEWSSQPLGGGELRLTIPSVPPERPVSPCGLPLPTRLRATEPRREGLSCVMCDRVPWMRVGCGRPEVRRAEGLGRARSYPAVVSGRGANPRLSVPLPSERVHQGTPAGRARHLPHLHPPAPQASR